MSTVGMTRFQPVMTEVERQRLFLERAASVLAERVLHIGGRCTGAYLSKLGRVVFGERRSTADD